MRVAVTGGRGQLGRQVMRAFAGDECLVVDLPEHDLRPIASVDLLVGMRPDIIIHTAAMTNVDGCALDPDEAYRSNAIATRNVALAARRLNCPLVAISTNEVFDGLSGQPYGEFDPISPINPYGLSKAAGEAFVRAIVVEHYIVRTAWLFGPGGNNFVGKILERASTGSLQVVTDEVGSPTYAPDLARAIAKLVKTGAYGTYHLVNEGYCSRHEFAKAIVAERQIPVEVATSRLVDYRRPSKVPPCTPLRNFVANELGIQLRPWQEALSDYLTTETL